jgi:hypothetical protein
MTHDAWSADEAAVTRLWKGAVSSSWTETAETTRMYVGNKQQLAGNRRWDAGYKVSGARRIRLQVGGEYCLLMWNRVFTCAVCSW